MKKKLALLLGIIALVPCQVKAKDMEEIDWKTDISTRRSIRSIEWLFKEEYEEAKTLYTTTYLNMRTFPNTESEVEKVLNPNTEVTAIADYNGWTKISYINENDVEEYYYLWNEYLTDEKQENEYLGNFKLTAYCACNNCCGAYANGITASGTTPVQGRTVAMYGVPFGTQLLINEQVYTVEDRGTAYGHVDVYFNNHSEALQFGLQYADVYKVLQ